MSPASLAFYIVATPCANWNVRTHKQVKCRLESIPNQLKYFFRCFSGIYGDKKAGKLLFGNSAFDYKVSMGFKCIEGIVEAAPQLVLQMYILIQRGLCLSRPQGKIF